MCIMCKLKNDVSLVKFFQYTLYQESLENLNDFNT